MGAAEVSPHDLRVLVLAPADEDADTLRSVLSEAGVSAEFHSDCDGLCAALDEGAGALLLDGQTITPHVAAQLRDKQSRQPRWSDLPIVMLAANQAAGDPGAREGLPSSVLSTSLSFDGANVTVVPRPPLVLPLITAVRSALRGRRRQYELRDLLADADRAVRQRDEFLAMLGHELRNPLGVISSAVQILNRVGSPTREAAETRDMIERQASHLTRLVDDLLDVSRVSSGKIVLQRVPVDLNEVARQCLQNCEVSVRAQRHDVVFDPSPRPAVVHGDPVRLEQILSNLLTNAIKYTPAGGRIALSVSHEAGPGGDAQAVVRVRDNGVGIEPDMLVRVFDMFTQADRSLDRAQGGVGMGLTLVRRLAQMHGGTVTAVSDGPGQGSEFELRLPALPLGAELPMSGTAQSPDSAPRPDSNAGGRKPAQPAAVGPRHVLIVEDGPDARNALGRLLELWGHHVELAEDGMRGVERAIATHPEVALVDIGLPGLNGYEVARRVRQVLGDRIRLIALTGYGQPDDHERTREAGFDQHLVKPVNPKLLSRLLAETPVAPSAH